MTAQEALRMTAQEAIVPLSARSGGSSAGASMASTSTRWPPTSPVCGSGFRWPPTPTSRARCATRTSRSTRAMPCWSIGQADLPKPLPAAAAASTSCWRTPPIRTCSRKQGRGGGKGDRRLLCAAPFRPFRQKVPVPFSAPRTGQRSGKRSRRPAAGSTSLCRSWSLASRSCATTGCWPTSRPTSCSAPSTPRRCERTSIRTLNCGRWRTSRACRFSAPRSTRSSPSP